MNTVHKSASAKQAAETTTTETQARMVAEQFLSALDIPFNARWEDREARIDLAEARIAYVQGYVGHALKTGDLRSIESLAAAAVNKLPVTYEVATEGGES